MVKRARARSKKSKKVTKKVSEKKAGALSWTARILGILFILFIELFALDSQSIVGFLIHSIPAFILLICFIYSWFNEKAGGAMFFVMGIVFTIFFKTYEEIINFLIISFPPLLIGILFLISGRGRA
jgi:hypothetical protein